MPAKKGSAATPKRATRAPAAAARKAAPRAAGPAVRVSGSSGREAVIVAAVRTAVGRATRGSLRTMRPDEMAAAVIREVLRRAAPLDPLEIDDVLIGCAFPEGEQGLNIGRLAALRAGLPVEVPGATVNRFCSSGMQTIAMGAQAILSGMADVVIAGGAESMSMVPMTGNKFSPNPEFAAEWPGVYLNMGLTAERVSTEYKISREDQDGMALRSNQRAAAAQDAGRFVEEIIPLKVKLVEVGEDGKRSERAFTFEADEGPRRGTTLEVLAKLKPAFLPGGSVTAGNSSQMSDGAAAVVVMEARKAKALGLQPLARFVSFAARGVAPEVMGTGPIAAVPIALKKAGMRLADMEVIELNEAFASQGLAVIRTLGMDPQKVNPNGGAIALGHPLGCTGAKLTTQIVYEMKRRKLRYGLVTMCIGGGMGAAGVFENLTL